jgi:hypothetical protein
VPVDVTDVEVVEMAAEWPVVHGHRTSWVTRGWLLAWSIRPIWALAA